MHRFFRLLAMCFCIMPLHAAEQGASAARACRLLFLGVPKGLPAKLFLCDGTSVQAVEPGRMSFSPVYALPPGNLRLALLASPPPVQPGSGAMAAPVPPRAPSATVPESISDLYLIRTSDPANPELPLKIQVVDAGMAEFSRGRMLWFNLTDSTVGGILGSQKLRIPPQSRSIIEAPANDSEDYYVNLHYVRPGETRGEPLCETRWQHDSRSRGVFFILKEGARAEPRVIGIPDFRSGEDVPGRGR